MVQNLDKLSKLEFLEGDLLKFILENSSDGIAIINTEGIIIKHNTLFTKMLRLQKPVMEEEEIQKVFMESGFIKKDILFLTSVKPPAQLLIRKKKIVLKNNTCELIFLIEYEPSSYKDYDEIRQLKEKYETVLNSIDEGVIVVDDKGKLIFYNPVLEQLEGFKATEVIGKHVTELYPAEISAVLRTLKTGKAQLDCYMNFSVNNKSVSLMCNSVPLYSGDKLIGVSAITRGFSRIQEMIEKNADLQEKLSLRGQFTKTRELGSEANFTFDQILGQNQRLRESINWGKAAARSESPIMIFGETGTGKELFAQSIHMESPRCKGPFLAINCAAIPEALLEGLLFGTTKGSFTGSVNRAGLLEHASKGTLFLDEVNSMPIALQAKLLRVLEEKKVRRLGEKKEIAIDVRIISSCNIEPIQAINSGLMRADLFYRLAVVYLTIPSLRERINDLEILINKFISTYNKHLGKKVKRISNEVLTEFRNYEWPGNVRQLKNCIEGAMNIMMIDETDIKLEHLPAYIRMYTSHSKNNNSENKKVIEGTERDQIIMALEQSGGNITRAARDLGISRQCLQHRIKKHRLNKLKSD